MAWTSAFLCSRCSRVTRSWSTSPSQESARASSTRAWRLGSMDSSAACSSTHVVCAPECAADTPTFVVALSFRGIDQRR